MVTHFIQISKGSKRAQDSQSDRTDVHWKTKGTPKGAKESFPNQLCTRKTKKYICDTLHTGTSVNDTDDRQVWFCMKNMYLTSKYHVKVFAHGNHGMILQSVR